MAVDDTRRHLLKTVAAAATLAALPRDARPGESRMADLILRNARITTLDTALPSASGPSRTTLSIRAPPSGVQARSTSYRWPR